MTLLEQIEVSIEEMPKEQRGQAWNDLLSGLVLMERLNATPFPGHDGDKDQPLPTPAKQ